MNKILYDLLLKLEQCDDFHNRCDYLMEHDEITYLLEYIEQLKQKVKLADHYKHLYSEVKKQKDDVVKFIKENKKVITKYEAEDTRLPLGTFMWRVDELLRMLGEIE